VDNTALAEFLKARRALVSPALVGLEPAASERRRVSGLRREELARLAGVSVDYYVRLEQGRDHRPSESVLEALASALLLDDELTAHLFALARPAPPARRTPDDGTVDQSLLDLLEAWPMTPATVTDRHMNVLAANRLAVELASCYAPGHNLLRAVFLDPAARASHVEWEQAALDTVANLRARLDPDDDDPQLTALVGELSLRSELFRQLWARHDVRTTTESTKTLRHPDVGEVAMRLHAMPVGPVADGRVLTVMHAEPGSESEHALARIAALAEARAAAI
jgi:transcriptional regulator with XRE-family HTH domain